MSTQKNTRKPNFWLVLAGLLLLIGLIGGGAVALNEAGLLNASNTPDDRNESIAQPDFNSEAPTDSEAFRRPEGRPDHEEGGGSSAALLGLGASVGKLAIIIAIVFYAQKLLGWLEERFRKVKLAR